MRHRLLNLPVLALLSIIGVASSTTPAPASVDSLFSTEEILDESTLETKALQDWHPVGDTRQKLVEINVAKWWPGQDYRIPVRLIVPLKSKAKGFHITGGATAESLSKNINPNAFDAKLLANVPEKEKAKRQRLAGGG